MASPLDSILDLVKRKVTESAGQKGGVLGQLTNMIAQRAGAARSGQSQVGKHNVRPASEDPYGDPADEKGGRKVKPASQDPYGDPADEKR